MRTIVLLLALGLASVIAAPRDPQRIVGGSTTTISQYPQIAALLYSDVFAMTVALCGGVIVNTRSVLTAAHCIIGDPASRWRARVGSTTAHSGGTVHNALRLITHPSYNVGVRRSNDIGIIRTERNIAYVSNAVQPGVFANSNYNLPDNSVVFAAGWGATAYNGRPSETLRHVQIWVVNQATCERNYRNVNKVVLNNMLCAGWLNVGGRDQCQGDSGGPLYHNRVVVGISSWGEECGLPLYPGVNTRISSFASWIQANS